MSAGKLLIIAGGVILVLGVLVQVGLPLGRLPGDFRVSRGNFTVYAPLATGIVLSIVLTIALNLIFRGR